MSSGAFTDVLYELDTVTGALPGKVQPETITTFNPTATATVISGVGRIKLSAGRREYGVSPRTVSGVWTTPPAGYKAGGTVRLPIFTKAAFSDIDFNDSLTYLGGTFRVTGKNPEKQN